MTKDKTYRFIEGCMYNYYANENRMHELRARYENLMSVHGHNYEAHMPDSESNPVLEVTNSRLKLEQSMKKLEEYIRPVKRLHEDLQTKYRDKKQILLILERKYFKQETMKRITDELNISQPTYWRRTQELMRLARKYFCEEE